MNKPRLQERPEAGESATARTILLAPEEDADLTRLAETWGCSADAALRRLIRERAAELSSAPSGSTQESLEPSTQQSAEPVLPLRKRVTQEQLRQAAEEMRDYYENDPEARAWAEFPGDTIDE